MLENNKLRGQEFHCEGPLLGSAQKKTVGWTDQFTCSQIGCKLIKDGALKAVTHLTKLLDLFRSYRSLVGDLIECDSHKFSLRSGIFFSNQQARTSQKIKDSPLKPWYTPPFAPLIVARMDDLSSLRYWQDKIGRFCRITREIQPELVLLRWDLASPVLNQSPLEPLFRLIWYQNRPIRI